jgi:hypothetical protein
VGAGTPRPQVVREGAFLITSTVALPSAAWTVVEVIYAPMQPAVIS